MPLPGRATHRWRSTGSCSGPRHSGCRLALGAIVAVVLLADLHVRAFHPSAADGSNAAYAAVKRAPEVRLVEVPVFTPDIHYGSVYLYYEQRVLRERPLGYSTTAPPKADVVARHLQPLDCGDWTTGVADRLRILKASTIALHRGLYVDKPIVADTAWMAWRGLVANGWRPTATDGAVTAFVRGRSSAPPPFPEPPRDDAIFCSGWFPQDELGHQMSSSHATLWVYGGGLLSLFLGSPEPLTVRIEVDGRPRSTHVLRRCCPRASPRRAHRLAPRRARNAACRSSAASQDARIIGFALP
jgi:hypothetical protein